MDAKTIAEVKQLASLMYGPEAVATVLGLAVPDVRLWLRDDESDFYKAYWAGYYETDIPFRTVVVKQAKAGSNPAQLLVRKMQEEAAVKRFYE